MVNGTYDAGTRTLTATGYPTIAEMEAYVASNAVSATNEIPADLDDLADVATATAANGEYLFYTNGTWSNKTLVVASAVSNLTDVGLGTLATNGTLAWNGSKWTNRPSLNLSNSTVNAFDPQTQTLTLKTDYINPADAAEDGAVVAYDAGTGGYVHRHAVGEVWDTNDFADAQAASNTIWQNQLMRWTNGTVYYCTNAITYALYTNDYPTPDDAGFWAEFVSDGTDGAKGDTGLSGVTNLNYGPWSDAAEYAYAAETPIVVSRGGFWWDCTASSTNKDPLTETNYWAMSIGQTNPYSFWMKEGTTNVLVMSDGTMSFKTYFSTNTLPASGIPTFNLTNLTLEARTIITQLPDDGTTNAISYGGGRHFYLTTTNEAGTYATFDASFDGTVSESVILEIRGTNLTLAAANGSIVDWATNGIAFATDKTVAVRFNKPFAETNWTWATFQ